MEEQNKSAFISKVEDFAKEMSEMVNDKETKRGLVILAAETPKDSDETANEIAVIGNGRQIVRAIAAFASQEQTRHFVVEGVKIASITTLIGKIGEVLNNRESNN